MNMTRYVIEAVAIGIILLLAIGQLMNIGMTSGEKRWATYTGTLTEFEIDCSQCCHPSSYFRINTSDGIRSELIGDCDDNLEHRVHVGNVYTIRIEPYAEPYAITQNFGEPSSFWAVKIDWIKDSQGSLIYGNEWW